MRISTKLAVGLTLASAAILGAYGVQQQREEDEGLRNNAKHDLKLLATSVQVAVKNALRDRQMADVTEILDELELKDSELDVIVFDGSGRVTAASPGSSHSVPLVAPMVQEVAVTSSPIVRLEGVRGLSHAVAVLPLAAEDGSSPGVVAVVRPLDGLRREMVATATTTAISIAVAFAGLMLVAWGLVHLYVRRPLRGLLGAIGAVRSGDLSAAVEEGREDELGQVAAQFNAMMRELDRAHRTVLAESEARQRLEAGLARVDKLATLGQLSAGLAHEIGSPLQIVNGRARALLTREGVPPDVRRTAQIVVEQSDRITRIVEQLLGFARKKSPKVADTDVVAAVRAIVELLQADARRRAIQLDVEVEPGIPLIRADAEQLQQVAMNLLTNALRATPRGGRIRVGVGLGTLAGASSGPGAAVCLTVEDTGCGIPPEIRGRIFEPFFTTWQDGGGTGLGLPVVKSIVTEHGGTVSLSDEGTGTRFTVRLPVRDPGAASEGMVA
ncbi:MAG TPA: ATP-binding protein [Anaeromyxobacteraceae bacterium]|nr:ATP-binding protein [Anaeromyxobacteraceae bacterium]